MFRPILFCTAAAALTLAACQRQETATTEPGATDPVAATQDAVGAAVGQISAATLGQTTGGYVTNAAIGDMYEVEAGKLAQERSQNPAVREFAQMIVKDHTQAMNEMKPLATAAGETPPTEMDERRRGFLDNLRAAQGAEFDQRFVSQQISAHEEALSLHRGYSQDGGDQGLRAHAAKTAPIIERHLQQARALENTVERAGAANQPPPAN